MHTVFQENILLSVVLLLGLAVLTVSVARRLHFPPILSYILVGIIVGPGGFSLIQDESNIRFLAEFGIVFLLFTIGLEFSIAQMRAMRNIVFGLGTLQVLVTGALAYMIGWLLGFDNHTNIVIASVVVMSSTAIAIKQLSEQGEIQSRHARNAIGVSIFQDISSIPLLILFSALAFSQADSSLGEALGISFLKGIFVVVLMLFLGRYLLRPLFHEVAAAKSSELFMLTVLLVALGAATFTEQIGLSLTLGAFLAGMMLGETQFRHQIESDIRPFQDILLGLFFITVGMMIMPILIWDNLGLILLATLGIILLKAIVVFGLMRLFFKGMGTGVAIRTSVTLAQVGEFGLVLIALGFSYELLDKDVGQLFLSASVLSMMAAPFLVKFNGHIARWLSFDYVKEKREIETTIAHDNEYLKNHVIVCGFGRVGQITTRFLRNANQPYIALDLDETRLKETQLAGENVYYGDASRPDILIAAKIDQAKVIIITHHDYHLALKTLKSVRSLDTNIPVLVRTPDDAHVNELVAAGATEVIPDYFESSIMLASHLLLMLGHPPSQVLRETRKARSDRYSILSNFYPGDSDLRSGSPMVQGGVIHAVELDETAYALGKRLQEFPFDDYAIHVDAVKRGSVRGENPDDGTRLRPGDTLIISGLPEAVEIMDRILKTGK